MNEAAAAIRERLGGLGPDLAMVLGSGLGGMADAVEKAVRIPYAELPGFPRSAVSGHAGALVGGLLAGKPVLMLAGRAHYYERGDAAAMRPALAALQALGVEKLVLTNAAGSLDPDIPPGSVMLIEDHINMAGVNPLIGEETDNRFVGMTEAYDRKLRRSLLRAAEAENIALHRGVYCWCSGPSFETPAEIRMFRTLGADSVGMSTVPEVILARFFGLRVAACSVITNLAAGMTGEELSHAETKEVAPRGGRRLAAILMRALQEGWLDE
jgi:purine-nucleoside phosphorylase